MCMNKTYITIALIIAAVVAFAAYRYYAPASCGSCTTCQDEMCAEHVASQPAEESHEAPCCQKLGCDVEANAVEKVDDVK
jgi:hypothetical protein